MALFIELQKEKIKRITNRKGGYDQQSSDRWSCNDARTQRRLANRALQREVRCSEPAEIFGAVLLCPITGEARPSNGVVTVLGDDGEVTVVYKDGVILSASAVGFAL